MDLLDRMLGHDRWATTQLLELCDSLTDEQLEREFDIGHRNLRTTLVHMIFVIDLWTGLMEGRSVNRDRSTQDYDGSITSLKEDHARFHTNFSSFARKVHDENRLDEVFIDHFDVRESMGATILQVLHHNAEHRSEIRHMLERLGVPDMWDYDPQEWEHFTGRI